MEPSSPAGLRITAGKADALIEGGVKVVTIEDGRRVAVARSGGKLYAFEDRCSHDDGDLAGGTILAQGPMVECPRHGARFDLATGIAKRMPAIKPIEIYTVETIHDEIWITISDSGQS